MADPSPQPASRKAKTQPLPPPVGGETGQDNTVARLAIQRGFATAEEVEMCRQIQQKPPAGQKGPSLGEVLVKQQVLTPRQLDRLIGATGEIKGSEQIPGFKILEVAGQGAHAKVFKARQLSLDRIVALKVLPREAAQSEEFIKRFYAEGRAAGKLNHPNVVTALDVGQAGSYHYFAMEFIEGETVFDIILEKGSVPEMEAIRIALDVAKGLEHAHKAGLVHRDVKPQNIILTKEGVTKLTDLGLARQEGDLEAAEAEKGKAFGTPFYISPEQIRGAHDVDFRADLYSLGATLYYMVTGKVPFDAPTPREVMVKHLKEKLIPPEKVNRFVSTHLSLVIRVCMAKSRRERYQSTAELVQDLEALSNDEPPLHAQTMLGMDLQDSAESKEEARRATAGELLRSTLLVEKEAKRAAKRAELMMYLAMVGWLLAAVFLGMWVLALVAKPNA